jgi:hypothetical protein
VFPTPEQLSRMRCSNLVQLAAICSIPGRRVRGKREGHVHGKEKKIKPGGKKALRKKKKRPYLSGQCSTRSRQ